MTVMCESPSQQIRVKRFHTNPLGRYYLYFAHHAGTYARLGYTIPLREPFVIGHEGNIALFCTGAGVPAICSAQIGTD